jgi:radical SAM-linked protein
LSLLEGVLARGDRHLGRLLERAYRLGCRLDGWSEYLRFDLWQKAFEATGIDPDRYLHGPDFPESPLPWDWIDSGVRKEFLLEESQRALKGLFTPLDCKGLCKECGICAPWKFVKSKNESWGIFQHAAESQETSYLRPSSEQRRMRFRYSKLPPAIFLGHLETMAVFQRAFRRTRLPLAFTMGQHPNLRISYSQALAVGIESLCEFLDVSFDSTMEPAHAADMLNSQLPEGFQILDAYTVPLQAPSLEEDIEEIHYRISFPEAYEKEELVAILSHGIEAFSSGRSSIVKISKKRRHTFMDLRPYVKELTLGEESFPVLFIIIRRWNESVISISRVLETLLSPDAMDTSYKIKKVQMKFQT